MIKVSLHDFALPTIGFLIRLEFVPVGNRGDCRICEKEKEEATKVAAPLAPSLPPLVGRRVVHFLARPCPVIAKRTNERTCFHHAIPPLSLSLSLSLFGLLTHSFSRVDSELEGLVRTVPRERVAASADWPLAVGLCFGGHGTRMCTQSKERTKNERTNANALSLLPKKPLARALACCSHCTRVISLPRSLSN